MEPNKRAEYITRSTQAGQKNHFYHSPIFLLASILALNEAVAKLSGTAVPTDDAAALKAKADAEAKAKADAEAAAEAAALADQGDEDVGPLG